MPSYRSTSLHLATLLAAALVLAGCGSESSGGGRATDDSDDAAAVTLDQLDTQRFSATRPQEVDGHPLVEGTTILVSFDGRTINAHAGCNHLFGEAEITDGVLSVTGLGGTEMGCPGDRMEQDDWLIEFLSSDPAVTLGDGTLTLSSGDAELRLTELEQEPKDDTDPDEPTSNAG